MEKANREFIAAMQARPDDWASHANLGNFYMERRDFPAAAACFETAAKLEPRHIGPMVNASMAYSNMAQNDKAERSLRRALKLEPDNAAANFNLGLLLAEQGQLQEAEQSLRAAFKADPQMAAAAYNLGVMLAKKNIDDGIAWCQKAHDLRPADPKYAWTLALYQQQKGHSTRPSNCCGRRSRTSQPIWTPICCWPKSTSSGTISRRRQKSILTPQKSTACRPMSAAN